MSLQQLVTNVRGVGRCRKEASRANIPTRLRIMRPSGRRLYFALAIFYSMLRVVGPDDCESWRSGQSCAQKRAIVNKTSNLLPGNSSRPDSINSPSSLCSPKRRQSDKPDKHCQTPELVPLASRVNPPAPNAAKNLTLDSQVQKTLFAFQLRVPPLSARFPPNPFAPLGLTRAIYPVLRPLADEDREPFARIRPTSNTRKARRDAASGCVARTYRDLARFTLGQTIGCSPLQPSKSLPILIP